MTIGDFSRAVRLSAKALRFYHQNGILTPASVDTHNGYRLYTAAQITDAQIVRVLRGLDVPVDSIREVLSTPSVESRAALMTDHLERMERKLDATRTAVSGLRAILEPHSPPIEITHRSVAETRVVAIREVIALRDLGSWFRRSIGELRAIAAHAEPGATGAYGGVWPNELFADERGLATVFLTVHAGFDERAATGIASVVELPAVELAVAVHDGPDDTVPRVYAALGEHVARHELATDAPVRETYIDGFPAIDRHAVTEIGWPIFRISH